MLLVVKFLVVKFLVVKLLVVKVLVVKLLVVKLLVVMFQRGPVGLLRRASCNSAGAKGWRCCESLQGTGARGRLLLPPQPELGVQHYVSRGLGVQC